MVRRRPLCQASSHRIGGAVHPVVSRSLSPVLSGTWVWEAADQLTVTVGGATYPVPAASDAWTLDLATAIPVDGTLSLGVGAPMEVQARVSRGAASATDASSGELTLLPPVALNVDGGGSASGIGAWPIVSGGSSEAGGFVAVRIDPGNDADLSDAVTYATATDAGGRWKTVPGARRIFDGPPGGLAGAGSGPGGSRREPVVGGSEGARAPEVLPDRAGGGPVTHHPTRGTRARPAVHMDWP